MNRTRAILGCFGFVMVASIFIRRYEPVFAVGSVQFILLSGWCLARSFREPGEVFAGVMFVRQLAASGISATLITF